MCGYWHVLATNNARTFLLRRHTESCYTWLPRQYQLYFFTQSCSTRLPVEILPYLRIVSPWINIAVACNLYTDLCRDHKSAELLSLLDYFGLLGLTYFVDYTHGISKKQQVLPIFLSICTPPLLSLAVSIFLDLRAVLFGINVIS